MERRRWISATGVLVAVATVHCAAEPRRPNVLLVVVDTLRADRLGTFGSPRAATPHLDRLGRRGTVFPRAYAAASWTLPSVGSMLSGLYPTSLATTRFKSRVPETVETLAERLKVAGYLTGAVVSHLLVASRAGFDQGFDVFDEREAGGAEHVSTPGVTERGEQLLREFVARDRPFFVLVHYFDPHFEYLRHPQYGYSSGEAGGPTHEDHEREVPSPGRIRETQDRYDEEVRFTDAGIGRLLRALEDLGVADGTIVVAAADHGEAFWEHGEWGHGNSAPSLQEEIARVPLIVRGVGSTAPSVIPEPVSLVSTTPTLMDLLGLEPDAEFQSGSWGPALAGRGSLPSEPILCEFVTTRGVRQEPRARNHVRALISGRHKLVKRWGRGQPRLYDLRNDPGERTDLRRSEPERAASMESLLDGRVAELREAAHDPETLGLSQRQQERLRALGYVAD